MKRTNGTEMLGIWIANKGWLKKANDPKKCFAEFNFDKAQQIARIFHGEVRYIDESLIDLEEEILIEERKTLWDTLHNLFKPRMNK